MGISAQISCTGRSKLLFNVLPLYFLSYVESTLCTSFLLLLSAFDRRLSVKSIDQRSYSCIAKSWELWVTLQINSTETTERVYCTKTNYMPANSIICCWSPMLACFRIVNATTDMSRRRARYWFHEIFQASSNASRLSGSIGTDDAPAVHTVAVSYIFIRIENYSQIGS